MQYGTYMEARGKQCGVYFLHHFILDLKRPDNGRGKMDALARKRLAGASLVTACLLCHRVGFEAVGPSTAPNERIRAQNACGVNRSTESGDRHGAGRAGDAAAGDFFADRRRRT